jgi:hypothetical protein
METKKSKIQPGVNEPALETSATDISSSNAENETQITQPEDGQPLSSEPLNQKEEVIIMENTDQQDQVEKHEVKFLEGEVVTDERDGIQVISTPAAMADRANNRPQFYPLFVGNISAEEIALYSKEYMDIASQKFQTICNSLPNGNLMQDDPDAYLSQIRPIIRETLDNSKLFIASTSVEVVRHLILVGYLLDEAETILKKEAKYRKWLKASFEGKHLRYFQQARQLYNNRTFALQYGSIGKNRLLELDRARKGVGEEAFKALIEGFPPPDIGSDPEGIDLKTWGDSCITHLRLTMEEINISFDQARSLVLSQETALTVREVKELGGWLKTQEDQAAAIGSYLLDKNVIPKEITRAPSSDSMTGILTRIIDVCKDIHFDDLDVEGLKGQLGLDPDIFHEAYELLEKIDEKLGSQPVPLNQATVGDSLQSAPLS